MANCSNPAQLESLSKMIRDGTGGTVWGDGFSQCLNLAAKHGLGDVSAFYPVSWQAGPSFTRGPLENEDPARIWDRAARISNSRSIHMLGNLSKGIATHCYAFQYWELAYGVGEGTSGLQK